MRLIPLITILNLGVLSGREWRKKSQLRRNSVATKRYCLCYSIQLEASHGITLAGKNVSLPFAIIVGPKTDVEAQLFLESFFANLVRKPLSDIPEMVTSGKMAEALEKKFQATVETPQKSGTVVVPLCMFTDQDKEHIILRLKSQFGRYNKLRS